MICTCPSPIPPGMASMSKMVDGRAEDLTNISHKDILAAESDQVTTSLLATVVNKKVLCSDYVPVQCQRLYVDGCFCHKRICTVQCYALLQVCFTYLVVSLKPLPLLSDKACCASPLVLHEGVCQPEGGQQEGRRGCTRKQVSITTPLTTTMEITYSVSSQLKCG